MLGGYFYARRVYEHFFFLWMLDLVFNFNLLVMGFNFFVCGWGFFEKGGAPPHPHMVNSRMTMNLESHLQTNVSPIIDYMFLCLADK